MKKHQKKNILRDLAKHFGLKVKFVHYLGDDVHGKLLPREKRILINACKPRIEHIYTLLHELGHYVMRVINQPRKYHPRFCDWNWKIDGITRLCSKLRRYYRFNFSKEAGKEWEADTWAMCVFVLLARNFGFRDELLKFLDHHPEKLKIFLLAAYATAYAGIKKRIANFGRAVALPFQAFCKFAVS